MTIKITRSELLDALRTMSPFLGETMSIRINEKKFGDVRIQGWKRLGTHPLSLWQGDESVERDWFDLDFQFPYNLHNGFMQWGRMDIITDKIYVNSQAWTAEQGQRAAANQNQSGVWRDALSQLIMKNG